MNAMRPNIFIWILAGIWLVGCTHRAPTAPKEWCDTIVKEEMRTIVAGRFIKNDTLFFSEEYLHYDDEPTFRNGYVSLEKDSGSYFHTPEYWFSRYDEEECAGELKIWMEHRKKKKNAKLSLRHVDLFGLPADWIPLYVREGKPYVYAPCEVDGQYRLTDSLLVSKGHDFLFDFMEESERLSPSVYHFRLRDWGDEPYDLYIYLIDEPTKAAIWEYRMTEDTEYNLRVPKESVPDFDLIRCWTARDKPKIAPSMIFDEINVKALLDSVRSSVPVDIRRLQDYQ